MKLDWGKIKTADWYHQRTDALPCFTIGPALGVLRLFKGSGDCIFHFGKDILENFFTEEFFYSEAKRILRQYRREPAVLKKYYNFWLKRSYLLEGLINKIVSRDLNQLSDEELVGLYREIGRQAYRIWQTPLFMDVFDTNFLEFFAQELENYQLKPSIEEINILVLPNKLLEAQKYKLALGRILKGEMTVSQVLKSFYFLPYGYSGGQDLKAKLVGRDLVDYKKNKKYLEEQAILENYVRDTKRQKQNIIKKYKLKTPVINLMEFIATITTWRDERKTLLQKTVRTINILGQVIARRSEVSWEKLSLCPPFAISSLPVKPVVLKKYSTLVKSNYLVYYSGRRFVEVRGRNYLKLLKYLTAHKEVKELKGRVACPGLAKGIVKIIHGPRDFKKFKKGDILVTTMTRPEFTPVINKALAIITDEGGITCHAAIISRELNIPCIIGTKIATRVLKDGNIVKIDGGEGIVKVLS